MSEPMVKQRPTADLDEFERRMRQTPSHARDNDPLAELARLVGEPYDPYGDVFAQESAGRQAPQHQHDPHGRREPGFPAVEPESPRLFGDFAAIEAGLRGGAPTQDAGLPAEHYHDGEQAGYAEHADSYAQAGHQEEWAERQSPHYPAQRNRRPVFIMAASIAVGVIGIGAAFALKGHISSSPREIRTIMADAGPTKIQPPVDTTSDQSNSDVNLLGKGSQPAPTTLVNHEEQPVDIAQTVQENAARAQASAATSPFNVTDASSVPVPPSPSQVRTAMADPQTSGASGRDAIGAQVQGFGISDMPAPKKVKVVSVRPDGTILPDDKPPAAATPAPRQTKTSDRSGPVAKAATPKSLSAKSTSRVSTTPKSIDQIAAGEDDSAPTPAKSAKKQKPQRVASAEVEQREATEEASPATAPGGGGFAVQLAAPATEAEAKAASAHLGKKFSSALGGRPLSFHKAESNGRSVYRVRVGSLSRTEAVSLCEKLKKDGGSCFVAKN